MTTKMLIIYAWKSWQTCWQQQAPCSAALQGNIKHAQTIQPTRATLGFSPWEQFPGCCNVLMCFIHVSYTLYCKIMNILHIRIYSNDVIDQSFPGLVSWRATPKVLQVWSGLLVDLWVSFWWTNLSDEFWGWLSELNPVLCGQIRESACDMWTGRPTKLCTVQKDLWCCKPMDPWNYAPCEMLWLRRPLMLHMYIW